jgi:alpha,alpha-trehalase
MNTKNAFVVYTFKDPSVVEKVLRGFQSSGLLGAFGIATSLKNSGQQWLVPF